MKCQFLDSKIFCSALNTTALVVPSGSWENTVPYPDKVPLCLNCTHLAEWQVMVLLLQEVYVSGRNDAHQLAAHFAVVCDGDAAKAMASLGLEDVPYALFRAHHHRVCDETLLITLEEGGKEAGEGKKGMG